LAECNSPTHRKTLSEFLEEAVHLAKEMRDAVNGEEHLDLDELYCLVLKARDKKDQIRCKYAARRMAS
jgi:hypothetical protein